MMKLIKSEWVSIERQYVLEVNEELINTIYENATVDEIKEILRQLRNDELEPAIIAEDAQIKGLKLNWVYDSEEDWWANENITYQIIYD